MRSLSVVARIRSVKPEFWEDEQIGLLSRDARLLYIATWNMADDEGLLRWAAPYLKANAFIYDADVTITDIARLMDELCDAGLVFAYHGGKTQQALGWIVTFPRHQKPNRPQPSKLAPPSLQNPQVRAAYAERDRWLCHICGDEIPQAFTGTFDTEGFHEATHGLSIDHVKARANGGSDYPSNIRASHRVCNSQKGNHEPDTEDDTEQFTESSTDPLIPVGVMEGSGGVSLSSKVETALDLLAERDAKQVPNPRNPRAVLVACRQSRVVDSKAELVRLSHRCRDWSAIDLANAIEPAEPAPRVEYWQPEPPPDEPALSRDEIRAEREAAIQEARKERTTA